MKSVAILSTLALGAVCAFQQATVVPRAQRLDVVLARPSSVIEDETVTVTTVEESSTSCDLPPVLRNIVDERAEFQMNLGRAMDILRKDYPSMMFQQAGMFVLSRYFSVADTESFRI